MNPRERGGGNAVVGPWHACNDVCMSTKTIAVDARVYERLAAAKHEGESFSETIDRLLANEADRYTGADVLRRLGNFAPLSDSDAEVFHDVVEMARRDAEWGARLC